MSSIPGPIISFRVSSDISGTIRPALDQIKREAQNTSRQIADDWKRMAAQIRATTALGSGTEQQIAASRKELVSVLDKEIAGLRTRNDLSKQELTNLKAQTLERERQASFLKGTGGLTAGTSNALNQVSTQTALGISRVLDSLVNRYFGGAAGAAFRTVRDVGYYSSISGAGGGTGGAVDGIAGGFGKIVEAIGPATIAATGLSAALVGMGAAAAAVTIDLAKQNEHIEILAEQTGFSTKQIQIFSQLAKEMGLDVNGLVSSVDRFQFSLAEYSRKGAEGANVETQRTVDALRKLGIEVESKPGQLRPAIDILEDLSDALRAIPDGGKEAQKMLDVLGIRGKELGAYLLSAKGSLRELLAEIERTGPIIDDQFSKKLDVAKEAWDRFTREIDKNKLIIREGIATAFLGAISLPGISGGLTQQQQSVLATTQKDALNPIRAGESFFLGTPADNSALIRQARVIAGQSPLQGQLDEKRKELAEAYRKDEGATAVELAKQVHSLEAAVKLQQTRQTIAQRIFELEVGGKLSGNARTLPATPDTLIDRFLKYGTVERSQIPIIPPDNGLLSSPFLGGGAPSVGGFPNYLAGIVPGVGPTKGAPDLLKQISDEHDELFTTQREKDIQHYADELKDLNDALKLQLVSQQQYYDALDKLKQDRNKTLADADKKYADDASKLFDDLLSGKGKAFGKSFQKDIINIVTQPIREIFDQFIGGIFGNLSRAAQAPFGGATGISGIGSKLGGIFGGLGGLGTSGGRIGPGGTAGWWPGQVGGGVSGAAGAPSVGVSAGQVGVATPVMNVHADIVNISGSLALPGTGTLGSNTGNFFGNLNPFANNAISGPIGLAGVSGSLSTGSGLGNAISSAGPYVGAAALIGAGIASNNPTAMALGAAKLAQSGIQSLTQFGGLISSSSGLGQALGTIAPALPGIGLFAGGVAQGGIGGTLEATAGGAQAGLTLGGPVGAAIGAGVGLISGIVSTLIQGQSFAERVKQNMYNQAYRLPPSETFSFAMGNSIQQTLSTGFNQSGSTFGTYGLAANTPFFANPITGRLSRDQQIDLARSQLGILSNQPFGGFPTNDPYVGQGNIGRYKGTGTPNTHITIQAMDAQSFHDFAQRNASTLARVTVSLAGQSGSGLGSTVRRLNNLP